MITVNYWVNFREPRQRIDIREKAVQKVRPYSCSKSFVEVKALNKIFLGLIENLDPHGTLLRIADLAVSQSVK
jgi:hypothetical protein